MEVPQNAGLQINERSSIVISKVLTDWLVETVIPAKAGIQVLFLGPGFRGDDNQGNQMAPTVESVITFENCYKFGLLVHGPRNCAQRTPLAFVLSGFARYHRSHSSGNNYLTRLDSPPLRQS